MSRCNEASTLLLVDDGHLNRTAFGRVFRKLNHYIDLVTAEDGLEALEYLNAELARCKGVLPPVIVLLDIYMPRMNGPELCDALRNRRGFDDMVMFAFGKAEVPAAIRSSLDTHIAGYVTRDYQLETLVSVLQPEGKTAIP